MQILDSRFIKQPSIDTTYRFIPKSFKSAYRVMSVWSRIEQATDDDCSTSFS